MTARSLFAAAGLLLLAAACSKSDTNTQVTVAFASEAKLGQDTDPIQRLEVIVSDHLGHTTFDQTFDKGDPDWSQGGFFPTTLAVIPADDASLDGPFSVAIRAWGTDPDAAILERRAVVTYVEGRTLLLPMPLRMACLNAKSCPNAGDTCIGGVCKSPVVEGSTLKEYDAKDVLPEAAINDCFDEATCNMGATPAAIADDCTFPVPSGNQVNVAVAWDDAGGKIVTLDLDEAEGWSRVDDQTGKLSPGVCAAVGSPGGDTSIINEHATKGAFVSTKCATKLPTTAYCRLTKKDDVGLGSPAP